MKTILLVAVIVCSAFAQHLGRPGPGFGPGPHGPGNGRPFPHRPGHHGPRPHGPFFRKCMNETGIEREELEALRNATADATLSTNQASFVCCLAAPLISNGQLNTTILENRPKPPKRPDCDDSTIDLTTVISSCELNGVTASTLDSCEKIAPFMHCVFVNLRPNRPKPDTE